MDPDEEQQRDGNCLPIPANLFEVKKGGTDQEEGKEVGTRPENERVFG